LVSRDKWQVPLNRQCELLGLSRAAVYYKVKPKPDDTIVANLIYDIWYKNPCFGVRRITDTLRLNGLIINVKKVSRIMHEIGIRAIYPKPYTSIKDNANQVYPYLLRNRNIDSNNQVWMTDITYIKLPKGFVFLCAYIDVNSRYITGYKLSNIMDTNLCVDALNNALTMGIPGIINSDQGTQFTANEWINTLNKHNILISHTGVGRCIDNVYIERFWRSIKHEKIYLSDCANVFELENIISQYILHYNNARPHSALNGKTPAMVYLDKNTI
jgi:putative transposase